MSSSYFREKARETRVSRGSWTGTDRVYHRLDVDETDTRPHARAGRRTPTTGDARLSKYRYTMTPRGHAHNFIYRKRGVATAAAVRASSSSRIPVVCTFYRSRGTGSGNWQCRDKDDERVTFFSYLKPIIIPWRNRGNYYRTYTRAVRGDCRPPVYAR